MSAYTGDQRNTDPQLGPLQDNGGPTYTHMPLPGSPAIDKGTNVGCPATDQHGAPRPAGMACDVGDTEYGALPPADHSVTLLVTIARRSYSKIRMK